MAEQAELKTYELSTPSHVPYRTIVQAAHSMGKIPNHHVVDEIARQGEVFVVNDGELRGANPTLYFSIRFNCIASHPNEGTKFRLRGPAIDDLFIEKLKQELSRLVETH